MPYPGQVHGDHVCPLGFRHLPKWGDRSCNTGVRTGDVNMAEGVQRLGHEFVELALVSHIDDFGNAATTDRLYFGFHRGQVVRGGKRVRDRVDLFRDIRNDDVGTLFGEPACNPGALPASSSGNESNASFEPAVLRHLALPSSSLSK